MNNFNKKKFFNIVKSYNSILDYGCGYGVLSSSKKKIFLFDPDKKLFLLLKKKYKNNNLFKILRKPKFNNIDVFFMNSVLQYLTIKELNFLKKKMKNFKIVIISDIPRYSRPIEVFVLLLTNPKRLLHGIINIITKKEPYTKLPFSTYSHTKIRKIFKNYNIKFLVNLDNAKFSRYAIILKIN